MKYRTLIFICAPLVVILVYIITLPQPEGYDPSEVIPEIVEVDCKEGFLGTKECKEICINKNDFTMILPNEDCGL